MVFAYLVFFSAKNWRLGQNGPIYRPFSDNSENCGENERLYGFLRRLPQGRQD
jgi:hypothetical protein